MEQFDLSDECFSALKGVCLEVTILNHSHKLGDAEKKLRNEGVVDKLKQAAQHRLVRDHRQPRHVVHLFQVAARQVLLLSHDRLMCAR